MKKKLINFYGVAIFSACLVCNVRAMEDDVDLDIAGSLQNVTQQICAAEQQRGIGEAIQKIALNGADDNEIGNMVRSSVAQNQKDHDHNPDTPPVPVPGLEAMERTQEAENLNARVQRGLEALLNGTLTIEGALANNTFVGVKNLFQIQTLAGIVSIFVAQNKSVHAGKLVNGWTLKRGIATEKANDGLLHHAQQLVHSGAGDAGRNKDAAVAAIKLVYPGVETYPMLVKALDYQSIQDDVGDINAADGREGFARIMMGLGAGVSNYFNGRVVEPLEFEISHCILMRLIHGVEATKYISLGQSLRIWEELCNMKGTNALNFSQAAQNVYAAALGNQDGEASALCLDGTNTNATTALNLGTICTGVDAVISRYYANGDFNDVADSDKFGKHGEANTPKWQENNFLHAPRVVLEAIEHGQAGESNIAGVAQAGGFYTAITGNAGWGAGAYAARRDIVHAALANCKCPPELQGFKDFATHVTAGAGFANFNDDDGVTAVQIGANRGTAGAYIFTWMFGTHHSTTNPQKFVAKVADLIFSAAGVGAISAPLNHYLTTHAAVKDDPMVKIMFNNVNNAIGTNDKMQVWRSVAKGVDWSTKVMWDYCGIIGAEKIKTGGDHENVKKAAFPFEVFPIGIAGDMRDLFSGLRYIQSGGNNAGNLEAALKLGAQGTVPAVGHIQLLSKVVTLLKKGQ